MKSIATRAALFAMALSTATGLVACKEEVATLGSPAPTLAVLDIQGQDTKPTAFGGKPTLINFWSASCGVCVKEMPKIDRVRQEFGDAIRVVGINTDQQDTDLTEALEKVKVSYPIYRDALGITQERYRVQGTPTSYLIDSQGKVVKYIEGAPTEQKLRQLFSSVLADSN